LGLKFAVEGISLASLPKYDCRLGIPVITGNYRSASIDWFTPLRNQIVVDIAIFVKCKI